MNLVAHVSTPHMPVVFVFEVHESDDQAKRKIDSDFYKLGTVPKGIHYELEIVHPAPDSATWGDKGVFHIHPGKLGRPFVCWPHPMPTMEEVERVARIWSAGTAYTILTRQPFGSLFEKGHDMFLELLTKEHQISIANIITTRS